MHIITAYEHLSNLINDKIIIYYTNNKGFDLIIISLHKTKMFCGYFGPFNLKVDICTGHDPACCHALKYEDHPEYICWIWSDPHIFKITVQPANTTD